MLMFAKFLPACHPYFHMLNNQIKQGAIPQIPSKLILHGTLPTNYQTTIMPSLQGYQLLSQPLIFLVTSEN